MDLDFVTWNYLIYVIGEVTILIAIGAVVISFLLVIISLFSIKT